jgi:hypothetical protein
MVVQILIPLLTILLSGLVATVVTHYLATSHQEKQFRRQKLEELYFSIDGFCTWFVAFNAYWPGVMGSKIDYHTALNKQIEIGSDKKNERNHGQAITWKNFSAIRISPTQPIHPKNVNPINAKTNLNGRSIINFRTFILGF